MHTGHLTHLIDHNIHAIALQETRHPASRRTTFNSCFKAPERGAWENVLSRSPDYQYITRKRPSRWH